MKRKIIVGLIIILVILEAWYLIPKNINHTYQGLTYQLGENKASEQVGIKIDGTLRNTLTDKKVFNGTINVEGEELPIASNEREIELIFQDDFDGFPINYFYFQDEKGEVNPSIYSYGYIYVNKDFSQFTITKYTQADDGGASWSGTNGMMITAPATNREEAIDISAELIERYKRNGDTLEIKNN